MKKEKQKICKHHKFTDFLFFSSILISANLAKHLSQTNLPLYSDNFLELPQKIQLGSYFFKIIQEPST